MGWVRGNGEGKYLFVIVWCEVDLQLCTCLITICTVMITTVPKGPPMSTSCVSRTIPATLGGVIAEIMGRDDLPRQRRQDLASAVRVTSRLLGLPPEDVPADPGALRARLPPLTAAAAGMSPGRWRNARSLFGTALTLTAVTTIGRRSREGLPPGGPGLRGSAAGP